ncbi:hypothetical protein KM176_16315 [Pseudooceanicola sp. CBS1P-1]|uniref:Amidase domain-containing protein n=1 Tax=Pseudooceanicola albus TaxID=2692189 RepID=A0A6L7G4S4_9RHOB|nr:MULTISPECIES: amidase family protein [Pseudooceanicola]MBT9385439.1 hypothetical protein [Pseudooceanicola endophyticus]MXN18702.1 hypothetical protein [Pseudooceanicola albus]
MTKTPEIRPAPGQFGPLSLAQTRAEIASDGLPALAALAARLEARAKADPLHAVIAADFTPPRACEGPLAGLPIGVKDNIDVAGFATTGGAPALAGNRPAQDASVVARLRAAGAWVPAKLNMHELAFGVTSDNGGYGSVRNPFDLGRTAGGSSGGSGAAVGSGLVPAALGSDTGASVRIPASFCGVAGLRPSSGRYPGDGVLNLSPTRDTIGVLAACVADIAEIDAVIVPEDATLPALPDRPLRLGLPADALPGYCPTLEATFRSALDRLVAAGLAEIIPLPAFDFDRWEDEVGMPLVFNETLAYWSTFLEARGIAWADFAASLSSPDVRAIFAAVPKLAAETAGTYAEILSGTRATLQARFGAIFPNHGVDLVVMPTSPVQPPAEAEFSVLQIDGEARATMPVVTRQTALATLTGQPSLTLPAGLDADGLPVGMMLEAPIGADRMLLAMALRIEAAL